MHVAVSRAVLAAAVFVSAQALATPPPTQEQVDQVIQTLDRRMQEEGDFKAKVFFTNRQPGKPDQKREALLHRHFSDDRWLLLITKPKTNEGDGYLAIERNIWVFDPRVGKWERRTDREALDGSNATREDLDAARYAKMFNASFEAFEKVASYQTYRMKLTAKEGQNAPASLVRLWVDTASGNPVKRQEFADSGKLLRTTYYPKFSKVPRAKGSKEFLYFPREMRIVDELNAGHSTDLVLDKVDLAPLDANLFTKGWVESKSR